MSPGFSPNSNVQAISGTTTRITPTTISNYAAIATICRPPKVLPSVMLIEINRISSDSVSPVIIASPINGTC